MSKPILVAEDILPIEEFETRVLAVLRRLRNSRRPLVITQRGKAVAVLITPKDFDLLRGRSHFMAAVAAGIEDSRAGRVIDDADLGSETDQVRGLDTQVKALDRPSALRIESRVLCAMNSILVIHPYRCDGTWVFDDARAGLVREPFVSGADEIIDRLVEGIPGAAEGFTLLFSAEPFPGYQARLEWRREEHGGNWYYCPDLDMEGWLCPALFEYFESAPPNIHVQCKARAA